MVVKKYRNRTIVCRLGIFILRINIDESLRMERNWKEIIRAGSFVFVCVTHEKIESWFYIANCSYMEPKRLDNWKTFLYCGYATIKSLVDKFSVLIGIILFIHFYLFINFFIYFFSVFFFFFYSKWRI